MHEGSVQNVPPKAPLPPLKLPPPLGWPAAGFGIEDCVANDGAMNGAFMLPTPGVFLLSNCDAKACRNGDIAPFCWMLADAARPADRPAFSPRLQAVAGVPGGGVKT